MRKHKHNGVWQKKHGRRYQKLHPVSVKHKDVYTVRCHNMELGRHKRQENIKGTKRIRKGKKNRKRLLQKQNIRKQVEKTDKVQKAFERQNFKRMVLCPVDAEGYAYFDLMGLMDSKHIKGVRVRFERKTRDRKRTVGLEIDK